MKIITMEAVPTPRRVLIVRLSALGDVLHCLPALEAIHDLWPDARVDWASESLGADILDGHPLVHNLVKIPRTAWSRRLRHIGEWQGVLTEAREVAEGLRRVDYDVVIDFQGNLRSKAVTAVVRARCLVTHYPSEVKEYPWIRPGLSPPEPAGRVHRVEKNLHLVRALGWRGEEPRGRLPDYARERQQLAAGGEGGEEPFIILHPATSRFGRFKMWPREYFAQLGRELATRGHRVLVTWGPGELPLAEGIAERCGKGVYLAPPTPTPRLLAALLGMARCVVAADTGPLHLASVTGVPVVGLFGPKDPRVYGPRTPWGRSRHSAAACSPCLLRRCEHAICMEMIHPREVLETTLDLLAMKDRQEPPPTAH